MNALPRESAVDLVAIASIGMQADLARMESISHNTANVLTPGFKRQIAVTAGFSAEIAHYASGSVERTIPAPHLAATRVVIDPSSGALRPTGNPHDVAIEGGAFFEVLTPAGPAYTKAGSLRSDAQGRLVTLQDLPVIGTTGELRVTNTPFAIGADGDVTQDGRVAGRLKTVHFAHPEALVPSGNGLYRAGAAEVQDVRTPASLRVGFLEDSNVRSPQEMVRLTETVRHFESLQRLVQGYDETLEKTIRKLGDF
jgi:flagellar basal-body rod protein FlgF